MTEIGSGWTCPICKKKFYPIDIQGWGYRIGGNKMVCSYPCQRKWETDPDRENKLNPTRRRVPVRIVETGEVFNSVIECAARLNANGSLLSRYIRNNKAYKGLHIERVV